MKNAICKREFLSAGVPGKFYIIYHMPRIIFCALLLLLLKSSSPQSNSCENKLIVECLPLAGLPGIVRMKP